MTSPDAVMTPLQGLVSNADLLSIQKQYTDEVVALASAWEQPNGGLNNPYHMMWCKAQK